MANASIRQTLLRGLMLPLVLLTLVAGGSGWALARYFSETVLDQWLSDFALSLATRITLDNGKVTISLPPGAREILEWDASDRQFFEVISASGERLIGNARLPPPPVMPTADDKTVLYSGSVNGAPVRLLAVQVAFTPDAPVLIKVAETLKKRNALATRMMTLSLAISALLATASAMLVWRGVAGGMRAIEGAVRQVRDQHAKARLAPIPIDDRTASEVRPLVEELNNLIADLVAAHEFNQRLTADAAHQLSTPLSALRVQLERAQREPDAERRREALADAGLTLERMGHSQHQILTLARLDESAALLEPAPCDLDSIVRETLEERMDASLAQSLDLGYAGSGQPVWVSGMDGLLREAIGNLIDNAMRYAASGGHITVGVDAAPPQVYVEDQGPGIPLAERARVCNRFYRMPGTPGEGCGIGLSIVAEVVRNHGGQMQLENGPSGRGLRVRLLFPSAPPPNAGAL